jgi:hypothetical protein
LVTNWARAGGLARMKQLVMDVLARIERVGCLGIGHMQCFVP